MKKVYSVIHSAKAKFLSGCTLLILLVCFTNMKVFSQTVVVNPTSPWVIPAGVTSVKVEVWGGGGGGGYAIFDYGGGGGGGAYKKATFSVTPGQSYTITIGAGGASDTNGGQTTFTGSAGTITANGGSAGVAGTFLTGSGVGGNGATGDFNGGNGQDGGTTTQYGGGGAGNNGSGTNAGVGGIGIPNNAPYKGGDGGSAGNDGSAPAGGGGGGDFIGPGGTGGNGQVVLTYTSGPVAPTITGFSPTTVCSGSGTIITISGNDFTASSVVTFFNNINATPVTFVDVHTLKVALPAGATTGPIKVSTGIGTPATSSTDLIVQNLTTALTTSGAGSFCGSTSIAASGGSGGTIYFQGADASGAAGMHNNLGGSPQTITTLGTHTYYFQEYNACGWGAVYPVTVTINDLPSVFTVNAAATCNSALLTPSGAVGDIFYFQGTTSNGTSTTSPGAQTVFAPGTYYYRAKSTGGCWGLDVSVTVAFVVTATITQQPVSQAVCSSTTAIFTVNVNSGSALTYQWRKGTTPLANAGNISGVTTNQLKFTNAVAANTATDYNCLITDACGSIISDYVSLTVNQATAAPTSAPTNLTFSPIGVTSAVGNFTASADAQSYIVVRSTVANPAPAISPVNGQAYAVGANTFGTTTYIEYIGPEVSFETTGLNPGTTYYYWVFAFNENACGTTPLYYNTAATGSVTTNTATVCSSYSTFYWYGKASDLGMNQNDVDFGDWKNWSTQSGSYKNTGQDLPDNCSNVFIYVKNNVTIKLSSNSSINNLTFLLRNSNSSKNAALLCNKYNLTVNGNATIDLTSGKSIVIGEGNNNNTFDGVIDFKANVSLGANSTQGTANFAGNPANTSNQIIFRGDVTLGKYAAVDNDFDPPYKILFDGVAQQIIWKNTDYYANFSNVVIGSSNSPVVSMSPASTVTPDNFTGDLTINNSSTLNLKTSQWNRNSNGGTFSMNNNSKVQLAGTSSIAAGGSATLVTGSNFPSGFSTHSFNGTSTVEYNGSNSVTQTIYNAPGYNKLILSNGTGSGTANKNNTSTINVTDTTTIKNAVTMTMGAGIATSGVVNVLSGSILQTGTQFITGSGSFNLNSSTTLGVGDASGITSTGSGLAGNIRVSGARTYDAGATYIYNGSTAQNTGTGLPVNATVLTILNGNAVTINGASTTYAPVTYNQTTGSLLLNGHTLEITNLNRTSGTLTGSHTSDVTIKGTSIPLFFNTSAEANYTLKTLTLNSDKTANLGTQLNITAGQSAGASGSLFLNTNATLTTFDKLTLKSNEYGSASLAALPVNGFGVAQAYISGKVTVERYINTGTSVAVPKQHGKAWQLLSTPVSGQTIKAAWQENGLNNSGYGVEITNSNYTIGNTYGYDAYTAGPSIKTYNSATDSYDAVPNTDATQLVNGKGYYVYVRGDRSVTAANGATLVPTRLRSTGTLYTGRQVAITIPANKYGTVGNPYASPVDVYKMHENGDFANLTNELYVWDPSLGGAYSSGGFIAMTWLGSDKGYLLSAYGTATYPTKYVSTIQSGQAFFVKSNGVGTSTVTFNEIDKATADSSRMTNGADLVIPGGEISGNTPISQLAMLNVSLSGIASTGGDRQVMDGALTIFGEGFSNNIDREDGAKIKNSANNVAFVRNGKQLSVERRQLPTSVDTLYLYLSGTSKTINYQWSFEAENLNMTPGLTAYLWDRYLNTKTALNLAGISTVDFNIDGNAASAATNRFAIVFSTQAPLPVTLTSITAVRNSNKTITVSWKTENEINLSGFTVERSGNANSFSLLGLQAATDNNGGKGSYVFVDAYPLGTDNYYRIKALSKDGKIQYSPVAKVSAENAAASISVYPNPVVNKQMVILFTSQAFGNYSIALTNQLGQIVYRGTVTVSSANFSRSVELLPNTATGNYQLTITDAAGTKTVEQVVVL